MSPLLPHLPLLPRPSQVLFKVGYYLCTFYLARNFQMHFCIRGINWFKEFSLIKKLCVEDPTKLMEQFALVLAYQGFLTPDAGPLHCPQEVMEFCLKFSLKRKNGAMMVNLSM